MVDDVHQNGNRDQYLEARETGILEAQIQSRADQEVQPQVDCDKGCGDFERGRWRQNFERPGKRDQRQSKGVGEGSEAEAAQTQCLPRLERGRDQKRGKIHLLEFSGVHGRSGRKSGRNTPDRLWFALLAHLLIPFGDYAECSHGFSCLARREIDKPIMHMAIMN